MVLPDYELVLNDNTCNDTAKGNNLHPESIECVNKNVSKCFSPGTSLQVMTSPMECARACQGLVSRFMFGTNESGNDHCNEQGCICSCGENVINDVQCDHPNRLSFETYQYLENEIGRDLQL